MSYAYPTKEFALKMLTCDPCYEKIAHVEDSYLVDLAWETGRSAAERMKKEGCRTAEQLLLRSGLKVERQNKDQVIGPTRFFCEIYPDQKKICLYIKSVCLWARQNDMTVQEATEYMLAHEYFHYLEVTELGLTSKKYLVPMLKIGKLEIGKTGIKALSEIGAYAFSAEFGRERREKSEQYSV